MAPRAFAGGRSRDGRAVDGIRGLVGHAADGARGDAHDDCDLRGDGRWIAYQSNESGRDEIYVRPFPAVGTGRWQVSTLAITSFFRIAHAHDPR